MHEDPSIRNGQLAVIRSQGRQPAIVGATGPLAVRVEDHPHLPVGPNLWHLSHGIFRGRYLAVGMAGLLSAAACGALAYHWTAKPVYTSEGLVRIAYADPTLSVDAEQNALPNFEAYMGGQKTVIASQRLADAAAKDPVAWRDTPAGTGPVDPQAYYSKRLVLEQKPKGEMIKIAVQDEDARTAAAAVRAIVKAYETFYNAQYKEAEQKMAAFLGQREVELRAELEKINESIRAKAKAYGATQLEDSFKELQTRRTRIEAALNDLQIMMTELPAPAVRNPSAPGRLADTRAGDLTLEQIAALDAATRFHWEDAARQQEKVDRLKPYGYGPSHRLMSAALRQLEEAQAKAERAAAEYRAKHPSNGPVTPEQILAGNPQAHTMEELETREAKLKQMRAAAMADQALLGNVQMELSGLEEQRKRKTEELLAITRRLEAGKGKDAIGGRLSVISRGEVPLTPSTDNRKKYAGAAGLLGFLLPGLAVMGTSLIRRRYRFSDDPGADPMVGRVPLMGMLPNVSAHAAPRLRLAAAYAAHHLRVLLSSRPTSVVKRTFLVTSAGEGEGKTTVTMALAISFAAAKHRTLVIDGDFVSRRLTRGFNAEQQEGLYESLGHGDLDGQWLNAASNLCILPIGRVAAADAVSITAENVRLLLEQAAQHFDVVLIDTGTILGSPESAVLAREVDGVIVTVSRGQKFEQVKKAVLRLEALGATVIGRVFNRSNIADLASCCVTPTAGWREPGQGGTGEVTELQQRVASFGPLVRAVAEAVPEDNDLEAQSNIRVDSSEPVTRT